MPFLDLVTKRQSCRKYSSRPVTRKCIERCLDAARLAPSACNSQPWHFIVIEDPHLKNQVAQKAFSGVYAMNAFAKEAPVLIVVIRDRSKYIAELGGFIRGVQYSLIDLGITCEHFILQAQEEGLGTCWLGWFDERGVKQLLNIPKDKKVDVIISLGYPQDPTLELKNRRSLSEISEFH